MSKNIVIRSSINCEDRKLVGYQDILTFELREVLAARNKLGLSFRSTGVDISVRYSTDLADALRNASAMIVGCMPFWSIFSAAPSKLPASTTTEVVPSPASTSWAADRSTSYCRQLGSYCGWDNRKDLPSLQRDARLGCFVG